MNSDIRFHPRMSGVTKCASNDEAPPTEAISRHKTSPVASAGRSGDRVFHHARPAIDASAPTSSQMKPMSPAVPSVS